MKRKPDGGDSRKNTGSGICQTQLLSTLHVGCLPNTQRRTRAWEQCLVSVPFVLGHEGKDRTEVLCSGVQSAPRVPPSLWMSGCRALYPFYPFGDDADTHFLSWWLVTLVSKWSVLTGGDDPCLHNPTSEAGSSNPLIYEDRLCFINRKLLTWKPYIFYQIIQIHI